MLLTVTAVGVLAGGLLAGSVPASSASSVAPAMLAEWTWFGTAGPTDTSWQRDCNWTTSICSTGGPYPDDTGDNATFPTNGGTAWAVDLTTEAIGDLTIEEDVDFGAASGTPTLDVEKLLIDADAGEVTITIGENASITVTP